MASRNWVIETWRTYVGNATSLRDFRIQMRGSKTILAWSLYLIVLLIVAYNFYNGVYQDRNGQSSAAMLQELLNASFAAMFNTVAVAIAVIAPGLTAASIAGERQRKSFDLVFTCPVTPKYYLVGKMLGSYRYTVMLLVLSIPVLALTAVLGGATWGDIAVCYFLLSMNGLLLTSIALLVSSVIPKVQAAVATSYVMCILYVAVTYIVSISAMFSTPGLFFGRSGPVTEQPFFTTLSLFTVAQTYGTYTTIAGVQVPNVILNTLFTIAFVRIALLGAGSALSPFGSPETKSLRVHGLVYLFCLTLLLTYFPVISSRATGPGQMFSYVFLFMTALVPWIAAWGESPRRTTASDRGWSWRNVISGTPSGAGPYLLALTAIVTVGGFLVANWRGIPVLSMGAHLVHGFGVLAFFSGLTRWLCATKGFAKGKVMANWLIVLANWVLPLMVSVAIASSSDISGLRPEKRLEWMLWPMWPIVADLSYGALVGYGAVGIFLGAMLWASADRRANDVRKGIESPPEWQFET